MERKVRMTQIDYHFIGEIAERLAGELVPPGSWMSSRWGGPGEIILILDYVTLQRFFEREVAERVKRQATAMGLRTVGAVDQDSGEVWILYPNVLGDRN